MRPLKSLIATIVTAGIISSANFVGAQGNNAKEIYGKLQEKSTISISAGELEVLAYVVESEKKLVYEISNKKGVGQVIVIEDIIDNSKLVDSAKRCDYTDYLRGRMSCSKIDLPNSNADKMYTELLKMSDALLKYGPIPESPPLNYYNKLNKTPF